MIPGKPKQAPKDPDWTLTKIDPRYVIELDENIL
jgi:hypothetical protein